MVKKRIRFLMAKIGQDGDDRGARTVCIGLRDSGMEVVYIGIETPQQIVEAALQEDADVIGISVNSDVGLSLIPKIIELAKSYGLDEMIFILAGGIDFPNEEKDKLREIGIKKIFNSETQIAEIADFLFNYFPDRPRT
ncbi:MAG: cobalamin B12-binding domain-containing protein [Candidatus Helarchaeota archaeon]